MSAMEATTVLTAGSFTDCTAKMESLANIGTICANMHQMASVNARFWIHPPLFQMRPAMVGATSSAIPQYQEWVGRQL